MTGGKPILIAVLLFLASFAAFAQKTKSQLQKEKQESLKKIEETERILAETGQQKKNSLGELAALNQRVRQQEALIRSIKNEIALLNSDINQKTEIISTLGEDLKHLKEEYAAMLFASQKASGKLNKLMFLFSSSSFDQLLMRLKYMEQYSVARKDQAEVITRVQSTLTAQVKETQDIKNEKSALLADQLKENHQLEGLKQKQGQLVKYLEKQEKKLKAELEETRKAVAKLDKLINDIIKEEMARAAREAAKGKATKTAEAAVAMSATFEGNKAKFNWPASGFISQKFGRQNHPVLKRIILQNDGINIQTKQNEKVKAIFEGEVRAVAFIPSIGNSVIISHGDYYTVYSGLKDVLVNKGQKVDTNQEIGQVLTNADGISELRFQIRRNTTPVDPELWLKN
ncbi:MAG: peptidoglycan DD-metalloendopeptidase family protein [Cyclobacteriaceae bacterium]|nr:peptidoglycan DD-metalloendopeptidase family protein [Cyclobacteriaceae bacterium]MCB0500261.1 peptidoglycan DD-metalloendopeptidase family protein [Cyclobacteriaceae bacterium]MCB9237326.1 peptidoglycan DD-metalloendopeptidase family protein [Flammeovirgaceae bacterium]MCO5271036.1 peptidoglycan DD-metalloendopeptidase family protein [Cyclobacteriaceae bacterium]MCW5903413.1 peptidoglycan DD-metalloendopeptidase family protein [Cyclobacteriaceae bacterium]